MIIYPARISEAELQAELWHEIKALGLDARLEVKARLPNEAPCRFDIVVFDTKRHPICVIECKRGSKISPAYNQIIRYRKFGVPILVCCRGNQYVILNEVRRLASLVTGT